MAEGQRPIAELPNALERESELAARLAGRLPAVFLDYDGTLTPIVDRPDDALISDRMRDAVRRVAARFPVGVVSGRDRRVVQQLMGVDDLIVAGSHGFDIWSPSGGAIQRQEGTEFKALLEEVRERLQRELGSIQGALVEPKSNSVAAHCRLVPEAERHRVGEVVEAVLREHPDELKLTPGKMVYEIQPKIDWDKGKAVLHLLHALGWTEMTSSPSTWATTSPTKTASRRSPAAASAFSWGARTTPRSPVEPRGPTTSCRP